MTDTLAPAGAETVLDQPYAYRKPELVEPDWTRLPGWDEVTESDWRSAQWQRAIASRTLSS